MKCYSLAATPSPLCCSGGGRRDQYCITVPYSLVPQSLNLNAMGMSMYLLFALFTSRRNSGMQVAQPPQYSINQKVVFFFLRRKKVNPEHLNGLTMSVFMYLKRFTMSVFMAAASELHV